jgi:hypothetical protein
MTAPAATSRTRFLELLDEAAAQSKRIAFWWRDDDAEDVTSALERLLALADRHGLPVALAVIPHGATPALAERLARAERVAVLQHGWRHANHSLPDEKKMELGDHRPAEVIRDELAEGFARLSQLFPSRFLPVLVPPWNRIGSKAAAELEAAGLAGLSTIGPVAPGTPGRVNTHVDIFAWKPERRPLAPEEVYALLCREAERRLAGVEEPVGFLSHHLVHEEANWALLDDVFSVLRHPAVVWPPIAELFQLGASAR